MGINTVGDLLFHLPYRYEDRRLRTPISALFDNPEAEGGRARCHVVSGRVGNLQIRPTRRKNVHIASFEIRDSTGSAGAVIFGGPRAFWGLRDGVSVILYGAPLMKGGAPEFENPDWAILEDDGTIVSAELLNWSKIVPIYPTVKGLPRKQLAAIIYNCATSPHLVLNDPLPREILKKHAFPPLPVAIRGVHAPESPEEIEISRRRLAYQELYGIQKKILENSAKRKTRGAVPLEAVGAVRSLAETLPFDLTASQKSAVREISADMRKNRPMYRLLQGDVGTGKTIVSVCAIAQCVKSGCQAAVLVPTTVLSAQFFASCVKYLSPLGIRCAELTGGAPAKERALFLASLASGRTDVAVGTHALLGDDVEFSALGLVIIDEQHRFGVLQRERIENRHFSKGDARAPHTLMMSATPIPRTLSLALYGDIDVTVIAGNPFSGPGCQAVMTKIVSDNHIGDVYRFLADTVKAGKKCFWVCRRVGEADAGEETGSDDSSYQFEIKGLKGEALKPVLTTAEPHHKQPIDSELVSVMSRARDIALEIPFARVGCLYGKMSQEEKNTAIAKFSGSEAEITEILVSTTVIEVGVDTPDASVIVIEGASGYGLSQLHQMRGRIGRGGGGGVCILLDSVGNIKKNGRLGILKNCADGFRIAEEDLKARGAGELDGLRQHGDVPLKAADLLRDSDLLEQARTDLR
jgi:ATP-dependent DNA helicase RecG